MQRFGTCLAQVSPLERRVLVLGAALDQLRVRPRAVVAAILGLPLSRVARIETRGLKRLREMVRNGGCGARSAATPIAGAAFFAGLLPFVPGSSAALAALAPRGGVLSERASGESNLSPPTAEAASSTALLPGTPSLEPVGNGGGFNIALLLIPLALLAYGMWAVRGERRI